MDRYLFTEPSTELQSGQLTITPWTLQGLDQRHQLQCALFVSFFVVAFVERVDLQRLLQVGCGD